MPPPKILLLSEIFPPRIGGSGRWLWELHRRLTGFDIDVVADDGPGAAEFDANAELRIHRLPMSFPDWGLLEPRGGLKYVETFFRLRRLVDRIRPDVIHSARCLPEGLLALLINQRRTIPFRCFAHGEELTLTDRSRELRWLIRRVATSAAGFVCNTEHTREILVRTCGPYDEKCIVLHPGVDASRFTPAPPDPAVRDRLGWTGRRVVLTVGALQKRKGQDMMIRALPEIRRRCPDVLYAMMGEGWEKPYIDSLVAEYQVADLVQFRGVPDDDELVQCYQQCDLFVLANRQVDWDIEGFGIVLIEAQACGKPVIAGVSGGTLETLEPGRTGELIPCETPDELTRVVSEFLVDPERRHRFGARARQHVVERFDWTVLTRRAETLFGGPAAMDQPEPVPAGRA